MDSVTARQRARSLMPRQRARRRFGGLPSAALSAWLAAMFSVGLVLSSGQALAATNESPLQGSSSRKAREDAVRSIPFEKLDNDTRSKVNAVVTNPSVFRRVPVQVTECDPDLYLFLVRHPEVVVNIWQVMGISKVALTRIDADNYRGSDGAGTVGDVKLCYSNHDTQLIYAEGRYEGPLFNRPIRARCVLVLRAGYVQETDGRYFITNRLDAFIHLEHVGLELVAKTFLPLVTRTVDLNFRETAGFVSTVSRTAEANPRGMQRLATKLTTLEPEVRDDFAKVSLQVGRKAAQRQALAKAPGQDTR